MGLIVLKFSLKMGYFAGPIIQANGRLKFEDDLRSGGLFYCASQSTSKLDYVSVSKKK